MVNILDIVLIPVEILLLLYTYARILGYKVVPARVIVVIFSLVIWSLFSSVIARLFNVEFLATLLLYPTYFIAYTYFLKLAKGNHLLTLFYGLFPIAFLDIMHSFLIYFIVSNLPTVFDTYKETYGVMTFSVLAGLLVLLLIKVFNYDFSYLRKKEISPNVRITLIVANISMFFYYSIIPYIGYLEELGNTDLSNYQEIITAIYFILFICFVNILDRNLRQELQEQVIFQKEIQLQNINNYSQQVEGLYQEVRSFRHDYANILSSLKIGIESNDIQMVSDIYDSVLKDSGKALRGQRFDIARLSHITDLSLKSLLLSKLSEAQSLSVPVSLEIEKPITISKIEQIDLLTIVAILMDNAIEAAAETQTDFGLVVSLFETQENKQVLIVQNATQAKEVAIREIFERGNSSKGVNRGIGLANVRDILRTYPNVSLRTTSHDFRFTQILEIEG